MNNTIEPPNFSQPASITTLLNTGGEFLSKPEKKHLVEMLKKEAAFSERKKQFTRPNLRLQLDAQADKFVAGQGAAPAQSLDELVAGGERVIAALRRAYNADYGSGDRAFLTEILHRLLARSREVQAELRAAAEAEAARFEVAYARTPVEASVANAIGRIEHDISMIQTGPPPSVSRLAAKFGVSLTGE